ncbi:polysaccharide deacetylase family protein [Luteithermobacter gelatinilyticus]|uniref:polysaccharide deacetylase family protein n=1 Tax=Luteithermobacter gelatinilyticus TaxID=2582913 RepID=UPI0011070560|nr:polysaccharide deacetylase family protein [Luteithermobacter gelatinilyticus]
MSLPSSYLTYPRRHHGMDHDLYPVSYIHERRPVHWPDGKKVALWITIALEFFPLSPNDGPFRAPGHMVTPFPDYRTFTARDYGNRVGIYRLLKLLDQFPFPVSVPMSAVLAKRYPPLLEEMTARHWEIIGHGLDMNALHYGGLDEKTERRYIKDALDLLREKSGQAVTGWLSPARSESENTLHLLPEYSIDYVCDWVNDDLPYQMTTRSGPLFAMPHTYELEDRHLLSTLGQQEQVYLEQIKEACEFLAQEAERGGGRVLHLSLTPYIIGQPFRIHILHQLLQMLSEKDYLWPATGAEILAAWKAAQ